MATRERVIAWLSKNNGVLTARGAIVARESYSGRSVIAKNSSSADADERGYLPVEHWIMSTVESQSRKAYPGEGLTKIVIDGQEVTLKELAAIAPTEIFGSHLTNWPLAKILDIGGVPVQSSFGTTEVPPGAVEVHRGVIVDGHATGPGKVEAYFYPPTDIPPYNTRMDAKLRVGLKAGVTKKDVEAALLKFGVDDSMYTLLNEYPVEPMTGWTVPSGVVHSAAAYVTFEVQVPQDGYNALTWKFAQRLEGDERVNAFKTKALKGLADEHAFVEELIDWDRASDQSLKEKYQHSPTIIDEGTWGKRYRIFFDVFYGEGWEIHPGQKLTIAPKDQPQAGVIWSGEASINGNVLTRAGQNEFLAVPNTPLEVLNTGREKLYIYTVQPVLTN